MRGGVGNWILALTFFLSNIFAGSGYSSSFPMIIEFSSVEQVLDYSPTSYLVGIKVGKENVSFFWRSIKNQPQKMSQKEKETNVKFFLLALAIPDDDLWVNLNILLDETQVLGRKLIFTDIGKVLMYSDVQLKKDVQRVFRREMFWDQLAELGYISDPHDIDESLVPRFWIVPGPITVFVNKTGILIKKAQLRVMFQIHQSKRGGEEGKSDLKQAVSDLVAKEIIPELDYLVNNDERYSLLRQVYYSCILAQWYKKVARNNVDSLFNQLINSGQIGGLQSDRIWTPRQFLDEYVRLYRFAMWENYGTGWEFYTGGISLQEAFGEKNVTSYRVNRLEHVPEQGVVKETPKIDKTKGKEWAKAQKSRRSRILRSLLPVFLGLAMLGVSGSAFAMDSLFSPGSGFALDGTQVFSVFSVIGIAGLMVHLRTSDLDGYEKYYISLYNNEDLRGFKDQLFEMLTTMDSNELGFVLEKEEKDRIKEWEGKLDRFLERYNLQDPDTEKKKDKYIIVIGELLTKLNLSPDSSGRYSNEEIKRWIYSAMWLEKKKYKDDKEIKDFVNNVKREFFGEDSTFSPNENSYGGIVFHSLVW